MIHNTRLFVISKNSRLFAKFGAERFLTLKMKRREPTTVLLGIKLFANLTPEYKTLGTDQVYAYLMLVTFYELYSEQLFRCCKIFHDKGC